MYDVEFMKVARIEEAILTITTGYKNFNSELHGFNKKIEIAQQSAFKFDEKMYLTIKTDSSLSHLNI